MKEQGDGSYLPLGPDGSEETSAGRLQGGETWKSKQGRPSLGVLGQEKFGCSRVAREPLEIRYTSIYLIRSKEKPNLKTKALFGANPESTALERHILKWQKPARHTSPLTWRS
jgi:hypothetical protein